MKRAALLLLVAGCTAGCNRPYLTWTQREPLATRHGHVGITVEDRRAEVTRLGVAFGFGGVPRDVIVPADEPRARLERLLSEALYTSGIGHMEPAMSPTARVRLELDTLVCDGSHEHARSDLAVAFSVQDPAGDVRIAPERIELHGKGRGCEEAFTDALDQLLDELASRLVEGPVHDAALGPTHEQT